MPVEEAAYQAAINKYNELLEQLKMTHATLAILLENEGGLVKIDREVLENYDLKTTLRMWIDPEDNSWMVQVVPAEIIDGEVVDDGV